jgi:peptidoglycan/LPS O-acetylase OafA/YrhL
VRAGFRGDIQGLRAVAVAVVVAYHVGVPGFSGGFVGVDVFFVISGFLITQHLVRELTQTGRMSLPAFYARRARRILPAAITVGAATLIASALLLPPLRAVEVARDAIATAVFAPNIWFAIKGSDYLASTELSPFQHYWSLGVEEQFYLVWPIVLLVVVMLLRARVAVLAATMGIVAVASFVAAQLLLATSPTWAFYSLHTRAWEFAVGGLVGLLVTQLDSKDIAGRGVLAVRTASGWLGIAAISSATVLFTDRTPFPGAAALLPVLGSAAVLCGTSSAASAGRWLALRPAVFVGTLSYSIYLVHWPILLLTSAMLVSPGRLILVGAALASLPVAWVVHRWVERPFLSTAARGIRPRSTLAVAAGAIALSTALAVAVSLVLSAAPTSAARSVTSPQPEAPTSFVPANLSPSLAAAASDLPSLYASGCHVPQGDPVFKDCRFGVTSATTTVALFGDSHAATWFPALETLATEHSFALRSFTKSACQAMDFVTFRDGKVDPTCAVWRQSVIDELVRTAPTVIIIANSAEQATDAATLERWKAAVAPVVSQLSKHSTVLVLQDVPFFDVNPVTCLSAHLYDTSPCSRPAADVLNGPVAELWRSETGRSGGTFIETSDLVCPAGECSPILGATLVYRDDNHLTATFARSLSGALWERIGPYVGTPPGK